MGEIIFPIFGWLYMWIRYRNKRKVELVLAEEYDNSYTEAGGMLVYGLLRVVGALFALLLLFGIIMVVVFAITK